MSSNRMYPNPYAGWQNEPDLVKRVKKLEAHIQQMATVIEMLIEGRGTKAEALARLWVIGR